MAHFLYSHAGSSIAMADAGWNEWGLHSKSLGTSALRLSSVPFFHLSFLRLGFDVFDFFAVSHSTFDLQRVCWIGKGWFRFPVDPPLIGRLFSEEKRYFSCFVFCVCLGTGSFFLERFQTLSWNFLLSFFAGLRYEVGSMFRWFCVPVF